MIAGMDNYIELWNPDTWRAQDQALRAELDDSDFFASLNV
jgi:DNA-binding transcriptional regulator/RsmH inhibitor MraZ